jgi:hypothetical protein
VAGDVEHLLARWDEGHRGGVDVGLRPRQQVQLELGFAHEDDHRSSLSFRVKPALRSPVIQNDGVVDGAAEEGATMKKNNRKDTKAKELHTVDVESLRKVVGGHGRRDYQYPDPGILHGGPVPGEGSSE